MRAHVMLLAVAAWLCVAAAWPLHSFQAYATFFCRSTTSGCDVRPYGIAASNETQCGQMPCRRAGCLNWTMGAFPHHDTRTGVTVNGGIPQRGNLTMHLELLAAQAVNVFPDAGVPANGVLDFEFWLPSWGYLFSPSGRKVREESIELAAQQHPNVTNHTELENIAKHDFEHAAMSFFVESMATLQEVRPLVRWGYYGIPRHLGGCDVAEPPKNVSGCAYESSVNGPRFREYNDAMAPLYAAVDALYPADYIRGGFPKHESELRRCVQQQTTWSATREAVRLLRQYAGAPRPTLASAMHNATTKTVVSFTSPFFKNGGRRDWVVADKSDAASAVANIWYPPFSTEVFLWGGVFTESWVPAALANDTGLVFREAQARADACAAVNCSGVRHGWCAEAPFSRFRAANQRELGCVCRDGFSGVDCSEGGV